VQATAPSLRNAMSPPDDPAIPAWPAYTEAERATMVFDTRCRVVNDPDSAAREMWTRVATRE